MSRTFTLARLMLGVTLFCVVCGLAVNIPIARVFIVILAAMILPTFLVWLGLTRLFRDPGDLAFTCLVGSSVGFFAAGELTAVKVLVVKNLIAYAAMLETGAAIGAPFAGSALLLCEVYTRWYRS